MTIGEKIKNIRTAKLMTQSELAGSEITRNMLSQIENDSANPSLSTLRYLASRLNISVGYLLSEGEDERFYQKQNEILGIKKTYLSGDLHICREACLNSVCVDDDEIRLILAECCFAIAIEEFFTGNLRGAAEFFDEAIENCSATIYNTSHIVSSSAAYFRYMRLISPTVSSEIIDESEVSPYPSLSERFPNYAYMLDIEEEKMTDATIKDYDPEDDIYLLHLSAKRLMRSRKFGNAYEKLKAILNSEEKVAMPMLYFVFCDLEVCCKECGDYKGAYEFSISKLEHMQKLLSQ